ncbi:MAG: ThiF family adenylyltransferase [Bauldia sp.]|nr:ThiF family adenylyltransferase [Bauldia sp.]
MTLSLSGDQHAHLKSFLFPGDGKEAVAILLCGRRDGDRRHRLLVREVHGIPYDICFERTPMRVTWPPDYIEPILERAAEGGLSVVKVHSHPSGYGGFSAVDDEGDARLLPMIRGWTESGVPHGSAVMLPDGQMFGRILEGDGALAPLSVISVAGDDLHFWYADAGSVAQPDFVASHAQAFDSGTIERIQRLSIAVIGCSGTGSPLIEQLVRLGVGEIVLVDPDRVERRNINRILNATLADADAGRFKVDVLGDASERIGLGTRVIRLARNLWDPDVIRSVAQCDIVFGCMDTIDGRFLLNTMATYYLLPYFDLGVRLDAVKDSAGRGRIREVCGTIHYLQPGRSSLISRELFTLYDVAAAGLRRRDPAAHRRQVEDGYIRGVAANRPAVISVNMLAASLAVNELLARLHPFREQANVRYASVVFSLASMELIPEPDEGIDDLLAGRVGHGDTQPMLGLVELTDVRPE